MRTWICEVTSLAVKTVLVEADTRDQAKKLLMRGEGEGIDVSYSPRARRVIREMKPPKGR